MVQKVNFNNLTGDTLSVGNTTITGTGVTVDGAPLTGGSGGATQYANTASLPKTDLTFGEFALVGNTLFITNGVGWYSVALINQSPSLSISVSNISLGPNGNTINFTYTASDPDGTEPTVTMTTTANTSQANVTLYTSNSTVTVENLSADDYSANITLTATDGIDQTFGTVTLTVAYAVELWDETVLSIGTSSTNSLDNSTFIDRSTNAHTVTTSGTPIQTAFHPYLDNWSMEFDGSGDRIDAPSSLDNSLGTSNFTLEFWFNPAGFAQPTNQRLVGNVLGTSWGSNGWTIGVSSNNIAVYIYNFTTTSVTISTSTNILLPQWYHIALTRNGSNFTLFVNGVSVGTYSSSGSIDGGVARALSVGGNGLANEHISGYISNFRLIKGTALYTSTFTPPTEKLTAVTGTSLLTCQSNRFIDNSSNAQTITAVGNAQVSAYNPFGQTSEYAVEQNKGSFVTTNGDTNLLTIPHDTSLNLYSGDYTVQFWVWLDAYSTSGNVITKGGNTSREWGFSLTSSTIVAYWSTNGSSSGDSVISATGLTNNLKEWIHVAFVKSGSDVKIYKNGEQVGSGTFTSIYAGSGTAKVARFMDYTGISHSLVGQIADLKLIKGTALYTTNFTPPTAPVGNTNASLYLPMDNAGIFDKTGLNTLTATGSSATSTTQTKFADTAMYTDGTITTDNSVGHFSTGDFTVEGWFYLNSNSVGYQPLFANYGTADQQGFVVITESTNRFAFYFSNGSSWTYINHTATTPVANQWFHLSLVRNGSTVTMYYNGTSIGTANIGTNSTHDITTGKFSVGYYPYFPGGARSLNGHIENFQILKGVAKYTTNFTVPDRTQGISYQAES